MKISEKRIFTALSLGALIIFAALNLAAFYYTDDYCYMYDFASKQRISSPADIFRSLGVHYVRVNGRMVTHFLAQLFLLAGKPAFNVLNTAAFAGLCLAAAWHISAKPSPACFFAVICGLFILTPAFGQDFLWITGAANYLYSALLVLVYMLLFRSCFTEENVPSSAAKAVLYFAFGAVAGGTLENLSAALFVYLMLAIIYRAIKKQRLPAQLISGAAGAAAGLLSVALAPGELRRLDAGGGFQPLSVMLQRLIPITAKFTYYFLPLLILDAALIIKYLKRPGRKNYAQLTEPAVFFTAALVSAYSMAASPQFPARAWCAAVCFMIIASGMLCRAAGIGSAAKYCATAALSAVLAVQAFAGISAVRGTSQQLAQREHAARGQVAAGEKVLVLPCVKGSGSRFDAQPEEGDITEAAEHWMNTALARYYGAAAVYGQY